MKKYLQHLQDKNLSENTLLSYANVLSKIPKRISQKSIEDCVAKFKKTHSNSSVRVVLSILKAYLQYLNKPELANNIKLPKKNIIKLEIPIKEIEDAIRDSSANPLHHAIIITLASTGLRLSELCNLKLEDYKKDPSQITIIGKGNKIRLIFFSDRTQEAINEYLKVRNRQSDYIFVTGYGKCYQKFIDRILKGYSSKLHPHIFRHYFAVKLLKKGANIMAVRDLLGHSDISTTQIYLNLSNAYLKETYNKYNIYGTEKGI